MLQTTSPILLAAAGLKPGDAQQQRQAAPGSAILRGGGGGRARSGAALRVGAVSCRGDARSRSASNRSQRRQALASERRRAERRVAGDLQGRVRMCTAGSWLEPLLLFLNLSGSCSCGLECVLEAGGQCSAVWSSGRQQAGGNVARSKALCRARRWRRGWKPRQACGGGRAALHRRAACSGSSAAARWRGAWAAAAAWRRRRYPTSRPQEGASVAGAGRAARRPEEPPRHRRSGGSGQPTATLAALEAAVGAATAGQRGARTAAARLPALLLRACPRWPPARHGAMRRAASSVPRWRQAGGLPTLA